MHVSYVCSLAFVLSVLSASPTHVFSAFYFGKGAGGTTENVTYLRSSGYLSVTKQQIGEPISFIEIMAPSLRKTGSDNTCLNARREERLIPTPMCTSVTQYARLPKTHQANPSSPQTDARCWSFSCETHLKRIDTNWPNETWHFCAFL